MRTIFFILTSLIMASVAHAQPADDQIGNAKFLTLFPQLREAQAPAILSPGLRVSYGAISGGQGTGGGGVIQYDVTAIGGQTVVLNQVSYSDLGSGLIPLGQTVALGIPGVGPAWISPAVLVNAESVASGNLSVTRFNKEVAGATREVVRFETTTLNGSRIVDEFSAESGLLVFSSEGTNEAGSQLTLLSARQIALPWVPDSAPNWAREGATLAYTGIKTTAIIGGSPVDQAVAVDVQIQTANSLWTTFVQSTQIGGVNAGTGVSATGISQLTGGFWLPKAALTADIPTQPTTVDQDPDTGATTLIVGDAESISVEQRLSGATITATYSRNLGVLVSQRLQQGGVSAIEDTSIQLTGGSDLIALDQEPALPIPDGGGGNSNNDPGTNPGPNPDPSLDQTGGGSKGGSGGCNTTSGRAGETLPVILFLFMVGVSIRRRT